MDKSIEEVLQQSVDKLHDTFERSDLEIEFKKIQQKIEEARYNTGDAKPLADCIFSIFLAARSRGFSVDAVLKELARVAEANLHKKWKKMPDGTYRSI